jgi:hypothetical protein
MARRPHSSTYAAQLDNAIRELAGKALQPLDDLVHGNTLWKPLPLFTAAVLMSWQEAPTLATRFEQTRELLEALRPGWSAPTSYSGYAAAVRRWHKRLLEPLRTALQQRVKSLAGRRWRTDGWILFAVDGSRFESPRTEDNERGLGCAGKTRTAPQVFHTTLMHLATGAVWDFRCGKGTDSERRHLEEMAPSLPPGSLVTADAGFIGYDLCRRLSAAGVSFLLRVGQNITLLATSPDKRVSGKRVWLWPRSRGRGTPVVLRLIKLGRGRKAVWLVTDLLRPAELSRAQADAVYRRRWGGEVLYRSIKQTFDRRKWLSRTLSGVLAEHALGLLGLWVLQVVGLEALKAKRRDPRTWSAAKARDATRRVLRLATREEVVTGPSWHCQLAEAVKDDYRRRGSKAARDWPHRKRESPAQAPRLVPLCQAQRRKGLSRLKQAENPAKKS